MKKSIIMPLGVAAVLLGGTSAQAQLALDVAKITCEQFATQKIANSKSVAIWLNGYHHGTRGDTIVDTQQLDVDADKMQDYCAKNPDALLMQAVETVLGSSK